MTMNSIYIIYDGDCAFCSRFIQFIDKNIRNSDIDIFVSGNVNKIITESNSLLDIGELENLSKSTIILLIGQDQIYTKSEAIMLILEATKSRRLDFLVKLIRLVPNIIRDWLYDRIAVIRKKIIGSNQYCKIEKLNSLIII